MVKYGVVGVGYFGAELARIMKEQEDAKVVVVFELRDRKSVV